MFTKKIEENEIEPLAIASLPTRPTTSVALGGKGYGAKEMKACFDALPRFIIGRLNALIEELSEGLVEERAMEIDMELPDRGYCFEDFIEDFKRGTLVDVLRLGEEGPALGEVIPPLIKKVEDLYYPDENYIFDAGRVGEREVSSFG